MNYNDEFQRYIKAQIEDKSSSWYTNCTEIGSGTAHAYNKKVAIAHDAWQEVLRLHRIEPGDTVRNVITDELLKIVRVDYDKIYPEGYPLCDGVERNHYAIVEKASTAERDSLMSSLRKQVAVKGTATN